MSRPIRIDEYTSFVIEPGEGHIVHLTIRDTSRNEWHVEYEMDREDAQRIGLMLMWAAEHVLKVAQRKNGQEVSEHYVYEPEEANDLR